MIRPRQNSRPWLRVQLMRTPTPERAHAADARAVTKMRTTVRAGDEVVRATAMTTVVVARVVRETAMTTVVVAAAVTWMSTTARMTRVRTRIKAMTVAAAMTMAAAAAMTTAVGAINSDC